MRIACASRAGNNSGAVRGEAGLALPDLSTSGWIAPRLNGMSQFSPPCALVDDAGSIFALVHTLMKNFSLVAAFAVLMTSAASGTMSCDPLP